MKERKGFKRLVTCVLTAAMLIAPALPASAATTVTKRSSGTLKAGQCVHIMNSDIGTNKISSYKVYVIPNTKRTRYDAAVASYPSGKSSQPTESLVRSCNSKATFSNAAGTFVKSSSASNEGMIACIRINRGSARVVVDYKTTNRNTSLSWKVQAEGHEPLKYVRVKAGKSALFTMTGSNLTGTPLILSAKKGTVARRLLSTKSYENYTFGSKKVAYRVYSSGKLLSDYSKNIKYDTTYSALRYVLLRTQKRNSSWMTTALGSVTYFYPSDYVGMKVQIR